jgi:hypothetical protein
MTALVVPVLLHFVPLDRLARRLGGGRAGPRNAPPEADIAEWVDRLLHRLPGPWHYTCLKRAAVLYALLRRAGTAPELRIGVRREPDGKLAAHAWLVREGHPLLEPGGEHVGSFQVLASFPEPTPDR